MTATLREIKDREPNKHLIGHLEKMLDHARAGRLRSHACVMGWSDDSFTHAWVTDERNGARRLLGEMVYLQHDYMTAMAVEDEDSRLASLIGGDS